MAQRIALFVAVLALHQWPVAVVHADTSVTTKKSWTLSHRVLTSNSNTNSGDGTVPWSVRGTIEFKVDTSGGGTEEEANALPELTITNAPLSESFVKTLSDDSAFYQIRIIEDDSSTTESHIMTTIPACHVRRANYRDEISLALNDQAQILSLSYDPLISPLAPKLCSAYNTNDETALPPPTTTDDAVTTSEPPPLQKQFESKVSFSTSHVGMMVGNPSKDNKGGLKPPPGLKWLPGPKGAGQKSILGDSSAGDSPPLGGGGDGDSTPPPPKGPFDLLKRYWYIVVPLFIVNLMGSDAKPAATLATDKNDTAPQPASQPIPPAPAAASAAETKRRGKKG